MLINMNMILGFFNFSSDGANLRNEQFYNFSVVSALAVYYLEL